MNCNYGPDDEPCDMCRWANGEGYEPMTKDKATDRPWRFECNSRRLEIKADTGEWSSMIAQVYKSGRCNASSYRMPADANAELIVTAVNERDQLLGEVARLKRILNPIVACYGLGLSPEQFVGQVGPWIEEGRAAVSSGKDGE
jgi:hypothetical protein